MTERMFKRTIGIDYSGADTPVVRLTGLAVYCADGDASPYRVLAPGRGVVRWHRKGLAKWLVEQLKEPNMPTLVGIDHAFAFPVRYFERYPDVPQGNWDSFLEDFRAHWPTDEDDESVARIKNRNYNRQNGSEAGVHRLGDAGWKRLTDELAPNAKSVFDFDAKQGNVAYSTHAGLPWLLYIREKLKKSGTQVHFWPFDGLNNWQGKSVIAEVYPALWKRRFEKPLGMNGHRYDAYSVAAWLSNANRTGSLGRYFGPELSLAEREAAETEGWILGVFGHISLGVGEDVKAEHRQ